MIRMTHKNLQTSLLKCLHNAGWGILFLFVVNGYAIGQRTMSEVPIPSSPGFYILPYTLVPGNFQVEGTFQYTNVHPKVPVAELVVPHVNLRMGLLNRLELGVEYSVHRLIGETRAYYMEDEFLFPGFRVGAQYIFPTANPEKVELAMKANVFIPTNRNPYVYTSPLFSPTVYGLGKFRLTDRFRLVANIGYQAGPFWLTRLASRLTLEGRLGKNWVGFLDGGLVYQGVFRDREGKATLDLIHTYNGGLYKAISPAFVWNLYGGFSVSQAWVYEDYGKVGYSFGTGLAYRLVGRRNK